MSLSDDILTLKSEALLCSQSRWLLENINSNFKKLFDFIKPMIRDRFKCNEEDISDYKVVEEFQQSLLHWENLYKLIDVKNCAYSSVKIVNRDEIYQKNSCLGPQFINDNNFSQFYHKRRFNDSNIMPSILYENFNLRQFIDKQNQTNYFNSRNDWTQTESHSDGNENKNFYDMDSKCDPIFTSSLSEVFAAINYENNSFIQSKNKEDINESKDVMKIAKRLNSFSDLKSKGKRMKRGSKTWFKCGFDGCSFGSLYSGVVERHKSEKHNGFGLIEESTTIINRFDCDWPNCGSSLVTYHKLVEHKRKHTGEKPFKCKRFGCNYATGRKYSIKIHDRTHLFHKYKN